MLRWDLVVDKRPRIALSRARGTLEARSKRSTLGRLEMLCLYGGNILLLSGEYRYQDLVVCSDVTADNQSMVLQQVHARCPHTFLIGGRPRTIPLRLEAVWLRKAQYLSQAALHVMSYGRHKNFRPPARWQSAYGIGGNTLATHWQHIAQNLAAPISPIHGLLFCVPSSELCIDPIASVSRDCAVSSLCHRSHHGFVLLFLYHCNSKTPR